MQPKLSLLLISLLSLLAISYVSAGHMWAGANCYYLHGLKQADRLDVLQAAQAAGLKVIRIFITHVYQNAKNAGNPEIQDVESWPGQWNDNILNQVNDLMYEAYQHNIKLIIALHDRYALGYSGDAYVKKYNIPQDKAPVNDARIFYQNQDCINDFEKRMAWILYHQNPHFNGRRWYEIHEAIFSFEAQNEAMGHMSYFDVNWQCNRAKLIKGTVKNGILVSTGGGVDFDTSIKQEYFKCPYIDVISLHTYDYDINYITSKVTQARQLAWDNGKRIMVEEFGAVQDQENELAKQMQAIQNLNVPWLFWEIMKPSAGGKDFEIWKDQSVWWSAVSPKAQAAAKIRDGWSWPEIWPGDSNGSLRKQSK